MKGLRKGLIIVIVALMLITLCACDENNGDSTPGTYTIQYADDNGLHTIDVTSGQLYSITSIPSRNGYEFIGLFDSEVGGTQYVNASGSALAVFTDNRSLVLYPQFRAKEFTLILDYQGANVTGSRSISVTYDSNISNLPTNLTMENKTFSGWFTAPDKKGTQIADQFGVLPNKSKVTESIFDLTDPDGYIYLYAGFAGEMHTVTFYYGNDSTPEEMQIEHGTYVSEIVTSKRVDGKAAISWTKTNGSDEVYTGKVESDMILWAYEYAPVIDFNSNGGNQINSIVAKSGSSISLPTPTRENYVFTGWYTASGSKYNNTVMGNDSVSLTARWNPILIFNTNGGTAVDNISAEVGSRITLPTTSKDGFMFAGWYTEQGQEYTSTSMPQNSVKLVAKYWNVESKKIVLIEATKTDSTQNSNPDITRNSYLVDLNDLYENGIRNINLTVHYVASVGWSGGSGGVDVKMSWYSQQSASDAYKVWQYSDSFVQNDKSQKNTTHSISISLTSNKLYVCLWRTSAYWANASRYSNFWVEIEYPDMSQLY